MSIDQLWAAYEEARAAEFAALDRWLADGTPESESAWQAAYARTTEAMFNAQMAQAAWVPETIEDMAARVMGEIAHEQPVRKVASWRRLYKVRAYKWTCGDYCAFVTIFERMMTVNRFGGLREIPVMSEAAATNAGLYIVAERERLGGLVFGNEIAEVKLTPLAKIELDESWIKDAWAKHVAKFGGGDLAWMG